MIRHLVMLKFQENSATSSKLEKARELVTVMRESVDGVIDMGLHFNSYAREGNFDALLDCLFINADYIEPYLISPAHQAFVACVGSSVISKAVLDYEVPDTQDFRRVRRNNED